MKKPSAQKDPGPRSMVRYIGRVIDGSKPGNHPGFVEPALATLRAKPPTGTGCVHEIKFDGYRLQACAAACVTHSIITAADTIVSRDRDRTSCWVSEEDQRGGRSARQSPAELPSLRRDNLARLRDLRLRCGHCGERGKAPLRLARNDAGHPATHRDATNSLSGQRRCPKSMSQPPRWRAGHEDRPRCRPGCGS